MSPYTTDAQEEDSDDSDEEDEDSPDNDIPAAKNGHHKETERNGDSKGHSSAFREFLQFLALGCYGSPTQGYPAIVVIISTIPPSARSIFNFHNIVFTEYYHRYLVCILRHGQTFSPHFGLLLTGKHFPHSPHWNVPRVLPLF